MRLHYLQHVPFEGLGHIRTWAASRGHGVTCTRLHANAPLPPLTEVDMLVIMGGPMNVDEELKYPWLAAEKRFIAEAISLGRPILGVCLGAQLLATVMGARVYPNVDREIGWFDIFRTDAAERSGLAGFLPEKAEVFHWHGDTFDMPAGAVHLARSTGCENQGVCGTRTDRGAAVSPGSDRGRCGPVGAELPAGPGNTRKICPGPGRNPVG